MAALKFVESTWERMFTAVENVKQRLHRAVAVLENAGIPYAVVGGHAVAYWVMSIDAGAERFTRDVDILVRRDDFDRIKQAMQAAGWFYTNLLDVEMFLENENAKPSESVHLIFELEKIRADYFTAAAALTESQSTAKFRVISLEALVRMKLESHRLKDQTHLVDMMNVGLIDESWPAKYPSPLKERLEAILNDPNERQRV